MRNKFIIGVVLVLASLLAFNTFVTNSGEPNDSPADDSLSQQNAGSEQSDDSQTNKPAILQKFTANQFKELFNGLVLPGTKTFIEPPEITGNADADRVIREIAESRGYQLQSVPQSDLVNIDGVSVQTRLKNDWRELTQAARADGLELIIRSGYRSVADQRTLFLQRLRQAGITNDQIATRQVDTALNDLLRVAAPPGYSRHHTGYTIDIADTSATVFEYSAGYQWVSADNYKNAKRFGFIPSYPDGATDQGPDPEAWEYVWANRDFVIE